MIIKGVGPSPNRNQIRKMILDIAHFSGSQTILSPMVFSGLKGQMVGLCALVEGYIAYYFSAPDKHYIDIHNHIMDVLPLVVERLNLTSSELSYE